MSFFNFRSTSFVDSAVLVLVVLPFLIYIFGGMFVYEKINAFYTVYNYLPVNTLLEIQSLLLCGLLIVKGRLNTNSVILFLAVSLYVFVCLLVFVYSPVGGIVDFVIIYKSIIYLMLLLLLGRTRVPVNPSIILGLYKILLFAFLLKYLLSKFVFGIARPGLFYENNFELILLIVVHAVLSYHGFIKGVKVRSVYYLVVILSGSRSALVTMVFLEYMLMSSGISIKKILGLICIALLSVVVAYIFVSRLDGRGVESIDRLFFLSMFLNEYSSFDMIQYIFGTQPITSLSYDTCNNFRFYSSIFSDFDNNVCFSVLFHSFILRTLFDHGVLGLVFITYVLYFCLRRSGYSNRFVVALIGAFFLNGLSVSSLNGPFAFISLIIVILLSAQLKKEVSFA
ncbi:hypothetical protein [Vibrio alginolyticus]|uniref:hypothetical protein n=1 Tax=Vibrio alginolyticus TaxID=663 RepID=UPI001EEB24A1|nr:hypothetical protein [Vibrio alginolyticus]MCG6325587.1 hypothetical protein [Vibrio alginolyticus]